MSDQPPAPKRHWRTFVYGGALLLAALGGAFLVRFLSPATAPSTPRPVRPIVQIVRQQAGLPDLADLIDRLCPSVAVIVPQGSSLQATAGSNPTISASAVSADGWLVTSAGKLAQGPARAVFGDGREAGISDVRTDPVSGLTIVKTPDATVPLTFSDQAFPRVGQFAFSIATRNGTGCSAASSMIASDFIADGGGPSGYVRMQSPPDDWAAGMPLVASDGRVIGISASDPGGAVIPAPIASVIIDELIRDSLSPVTDFGFRAIDYAAPFATRLGDVRTGAGVALVQPKSAAAKAGLMAGDIVTGVDGDPVSSASELSRALDALTDKATLTVQRKSQQLTLTIRRAGNT